MINKLSRFTLKYSVIMAFTLLLLFPLVNFRIGFATGIFPALEIIFIYYFSTYYRFSYLIIFITGLLLDQLYSFPFGLNSLIFISGKILLKFTGRWFLLKAYDINFMIFIGYTLFVYILRYLLVASKSLYYPSGSEIIFQYLTTIFSYPLIRIMLDKSGKYLRAHAK